MHGRVKVKRTAEQEKLRKDSSEKSEHKFRTLLDEIFQFRRSGLYTDDKLKLVEKAVEIVPDMTTLWNYRREILKHLLKTDCSQIVSNTLFDNELQLTARCLVKSPKSYSVWHHRMWILKHHENPLWESENEFCISTLKQDERNFHCWDYKRFVVSHGKMPLESELAYTENEIGTNMSNYSAWHYRSELLSRSDPFYRAVLPISPPPTTLDSKAICLPVRPCLSKAELELLHNAVYTDPSDQSPWFYYWWILGRGVRTTYIRELYISRPLGRIVLVFTAPKPRSALEQLEELILDDNRLTSLARLSHLPSLVVLSVQRNRLDDFTAIEELLLCPKLQSVSIDGNNVTEIPNLSKLFADHPCFRTRFQSFILAYGKPLNP
ncbi:unnamed protein product [Dicrocoelium dendriticum]|nr:unnamed protein product [Dicrocoelium dendriticum]